jgi:GLPGLI family protein
MRTFISILSFLFSVCAFAQFNPNEPYNTVKNKVLEKSKTECVYTHIIKDVVLNEKRSYDEILLVGSKFSKYFEYGVFQVDSVTYDSGKKNWTFAEHYDLDASYHYNSRFFEISRIIGSNKLTYADAVVIDKYIYEDSVSFKWKIGKEKMTICGYPCRKATCVFRGRKWEAWFTNKIPISLGPWKFCGLPGLILKVNDDKHEHVYYATCVRKGGSPIRQFERSYMKSTREKVNKAFKAYHEDCTTVWGNTALAPKDMNGKTVEIPSKRLFFNAIEKE